jgi:hypothetical protein
MELDRAFVDEPEEPGVIDLRDDLVARYGGEAIDRQATPTDAPRAGRESLGKPQCDFSRGRLLGHVTRVDRDRVLVRLADTNLASHVSVSELVAVTAGETFLIGILEAVSLTDTDGIDALIMPVGTLRPGPADSPDTFVRGVAVYPHVGDDCHLVEADALESFMSVIADDVAPEERLVLGHYGNGHPAVADGNRMFQRHLALLGSTGSGKSWAVGLLLERASRLNHSNLIVLDLHGEYGPLTRRNGSEPSAQHLRIAGPSDLGRSDPGLLYLPYWLLERSALMSLLADPNDRRISDAAFRLSEHVVSLKHTSLIDAAREDALATFTADSPIPYDLAHLVQALKRDDTERIPQPPSNVPAPGPFHGRLTGFISRLEARAADPRYGFIFNPPPETLESDWLSKMAGRLLGSSRGTPGVKIVDLSEVPSEVVPLVAGLIARLVFNVQFWTSHAKRTPVCLVCDEAHLYIPELTGGSPIQEAAVRSFEAIAKEGRKYGVGLVVVSQRPADVSSTVLSQCNNFLILRLTNDNDQSVIERLVPQNVSGIVGMLPSLEPGEAMLIGDALLLPTRMRLDPPHVPPASSTQAFWSMWRDLEPDGRAIHAGVDALQTQLRPAE